MAPDEHDEAKLYAELEYWRKRHLELESRVKSLLDEEKLLKSLRDEEKRLRNENKWLKVHCRHGRILTPKCSCNEASRRHAGGHANRAFAPGLTGARYQVVTYTLSNEAGFSRARPIRRNAHGYATFIPSVTGFLHAGTGVTPVLISGRKNPDAAQSS